MPRLGAETTNTGTTFGFSPVDLTTLGASEYTLVNIAVDTSASTGGFERAMEGCLGTIVDSLRKSPRCDNLLLRVFEFNNTVHEVHGFKLLQDCNAADYSGKLRSRGSTALYDAVYSAVESVDAQGRTLMQNDYLANGIVYIITDGEENCSSVREDTVKKLMEGVTKTETLESLVTVLISLGDSSQLHAFKNSLGITQYERLKDASASNLAKLAGFISKSVSSQSQALGTGGPSQALPTI